MALGYDRIDLLSESAGTRYAMIYAWRYPKSIHRSVMIGVNPPGNFLWDAKTTDEQIGRYAELCSKDDDCSKRTDDLAATMQRGRDIPKRWGFLPIKAGQRPDRHLLRPHGVDLGGGAALCADDAELVDLGCRRRRERILVPVAARRPRLPEVVRLGRDGGHGAGRRRAPRSATSRRASTQPGHRLHLGRRRAGRRLARRPRRTPSTTACARRTWRRS